MHSVRQTVRWLLLFACAALLGISGCVSPPIAFHDGLPAWSPPTGKGEASVGYHRMFWSESDGSVGYLTPGFRLGLAPPPTAADIGLTTAVFESDGHFAALLGPALGFGYNGQDGNLIVRPGAYVLGISEEDADFFDEPLWQVSVLAGNGYQPGKTHVSGGGRISRLGVGPVFLVGHSLGRANLRLEGSYTFAYNDDAEGRLLTFGLTVGGPTP